MVVSKDILVRFSEAEICDPLHVPNPSCNVYVVHDVECTPTQPDKTIKLDAQELEKFVKYSNIGYLPCRHHPHQVITGVDVAADIQQRR